MINSLLNQFIAHQKFVRQFFFQDLKLPLFKRKKTPLVIYSQVAWDSVWQRPQEKAMGLSRHRPVIFISPVQMHELAGRLSQEWQFSRAYNNSNLLVLSPLLLNGHYRSSYIRRLNDEVLRRIFDLMNRLPKPIFMTDTPFCAPFIDHLLAKAVVYDIIDDFPGFNWAPENARVWEHNLFSRLDLCFAGTGYLYERNKERFPSIHHLPSGVNLEKMQRPTDEPIDLKDLPQPRALYVGTLNDRINGELFIAASKAVEKGSVVIVGPKHGTFEISGHPSNLHFLGLKSHSEIPGYYQHCDIGLMPFADCPAAKAINPIKTLEYLSAGLPVICTPVPSDVRKYYSSVVNIAEEENWEEEIKTIIRNDNQSLRIKRKGFCENHTWESMVTEMEARLAELDR